MGQHSPDTTRAAQRRETEQRILDVARETFAELGYDRATVRAIAEASGVNPGLVMHYYGSKQRLFRTATAEPPDPAPGEPPEDPGERWLAALREKLASEPTATLAMLRSMLTHPDAQDEVRESMRAQQRELAAELDAEDALLRTGLLGALTLGVLVSRYLLRLDGMPEADPDTLLDLLRPCVDSLNGKPPGEKS